MAHVVRPHLVGRRQPPARRQEPRGIRVPSRRRFIAQRKRQVAEVGAHGHAGGDTEISVAPEMIEDVLAGVVLGPLVKSRM